MQKVHLIGNAHLDPVWLWQWQEGFAEIKATYRSALDRMKEYDDFIFTSACGAYYMWIEKIDPEIDEAFREEKVILQGAVDLAFVEDGQLVIVDYKTDRVKDPQTLNDRYASQLLLYKDAMEECLGLPVKECLIYSIHHSAQIEVYRK